MVLVISWTVARRTRSSNIFPVLAVSVLGIASFIVAMLGAGGYVPPVERWLVGFYSPLTRAWEFAVGSMLALAGARAAVRSRRVAAGFGLLGVFLIVLSMLMITATTPFPGPATLVPVLGTLMLLIAGSLQGGLTEHIFASRPLVLIGDWSYSLYLWHWPLIVFATLLWPHSPWAAPAAAIISIIPAAASYRWVETPLRTQATRTPRGLVYFVLAVVTPPLVLSASLWQASENGFWRPDVQRFQSAVFAEPQVCKNLNPLSPENAPGCTWNAAADGPSIYLLGDSHAAHFSEAAVAAGKALERPVTITTTNSCPFLDIFATNSGLPRAVNAACRDFTQGSLDFLRGAEPGTVVISNIDTYWSSSNWHIGLTEATADSDSGVKLTALADGLTQTIQTLRHAGHRVVLVQTIPLFSGKDAWNTAGCTVAAIEAGECIHDMPMESAQARQGAIRDVVARVAQAENTALIDPWPALCPNAVCTTQGPGFPRYYRDGIHLSTAQSRELAPEFAAALRAADA